MGARAALAALAVVSVALAGCTIPTEDPFDPGPRPQGYDARDAVGWRWEAAQEPPAAVADAACMVFEGDLWLLGGIDRNGFVTGRVQVFDPSQGVWRPQVSLPTPVHAAAAVPLDDRFQVVGGYTEAGRHGVSSDVQEHTATGLYFHGDNTPNLPLPLAEAHTVTLTGRPLLLGGTHDGRQASPDVYAHSGGFLLQSWGLAGSLAAARADGGYQALTGASVIAAGGWDRVGGWPLHDVILQDLDGNQVKSWPTVPTPRQDFASTVHGRNLFIIGGTDSDGEVSAAVEFLDLDGEGWWEVPPMPVPAADACAFSLPDGIHVIGGFNNQGEAVSAHWVLKGP